MDLRSQDTLLDIQQEKEDILESNPTQLIDETILQDELEVKCSQLEEGQVDINDPHTDLHEFDYLSSKQKEYFFKYRKLMGDFISKEELQSIPYWDEALVNKIYPWVRIGLRNRAMNELSERFKKGVSTLFFQSNRILQESVGFGFDSTCFSKPFLGSPYGYSLKYNFRYRRLLQIGFLVDKDPGEQLVSNKSNRLEFFSGHICLTRFRKIKNFVIGDYTVNIGQGLFQWQSIANNKGLNVLAIKRESEIIKPYNSFKEFGFFRGAAVTMQFGNWDATIFLSNKKLDAYVVQDSFYSNAIQVSSIIATGLHRTRVELFHKNKQELTVLGSSIQKVSQKYKLGLSTVSYYFNWPIQEKKSTKDIYDFKGKQLVILGGNYEYTFKNFHFFGEMAIASNTGKAFISGLITSVSKNMDIALLHRDISKSFQCFYSRPFAENWEGRNENGSYLGVTFSTINNWKFNLYVDKFKSYWLFGGSNAVPNGQECLLSAYRSYGKASSLEIVLKNKNLENAIDGVYDNVKSLRLTVKMQLSGNGELVQMFQLGDFWRKNERREDGLLISTVIRKKIINNNTQGIFQMVFFNTDSYQSRFFLTEWDGMNSVTSSLYYDSGVKIRCVMNERINKNLDLGLKISNIHYFKRKSIGYDLDKINGNQKTNFSIKILIKI